MVDRHAINNMHPATVVDLDGTYVDGNTLKIYIFAGIWHCIKKMHLCSLVKISFLLCCRKLHLVSHKRMKFGILGILLPKQQFLPEFRQMVLKRINPNVSKLIELNNKAGHRILLATAAPDNYITLVWDGQFIATPTTDNDMHIECRGSNKLEMTKQWLSQNNCYLDTVITDHHDDAPLFKYNISGTNVLVNPSKKTLRFFRELEPAHFLLIEDINNLCISS